MRDVSNQASGSGGSRALACSLRRLLLSRRLLVAVLFMVSSLVLPASVLAAGDGVPYLIVTTKSGEILLDVPLPADHTWRHEWTHSVAQVQVVDVFAWRDGVLYVTDQYTPYLDIAGLGAFAGRGDLTELDDGSYHLANIDLPLHGNALDLIIGSVRAPSVLLVGERRFELSETHPATHARIEVRLK